jgi:hypothetical protein
MTSDLFFDDLRRELYALASYGSLDGQKEATAETSEQGGKLAGLV